MPSRQQFKGAASGEGDIQETRIPFMGSALSRAIDAAKDQRFVNGYFDILKNQETNKTHYFFCKRPGLTQTGGTRPSGTTGVGRGCYVWNGKLYSVVGTKIYSGTTDLGVTLKTSTGIVGFAETRGGIATERLGINDGINIYLITLTDTITSVAVKSSTVTITQASPAVVSWATHANTAGTPVVFNSTVSLPTGITAGTTYYVMATGLTAGAFQISATPGGAAINTSSAGSGTFTATIPTLPDLVYQDGYWFVLRAFDANLLSCTVDDPTTWDLSHFLISMMYVGVGVGLKRQNNLMVVFLDRSIQFFYDAANVAGSPMANVEQALQQLGCASGESLAEHEGQIFWVTNHHTVARLDGVTSLTEIQTPDIQRLLDAEGTSLASTRGFVLHVGGRTLYILNLSAAGRTYVYDIDGHFWFEWQATDGGVWPIVAETEKSNVYLCQHATNGWIYALSATVYQDDSTNFTVLARLSRLDFDSTKWKYVKRLDLIGDKQATTTNVSLQYSDDDYVTLSTARTINMANSINFVTNLGRFQRRSFQVSYAGNNPLRLEAINLRVRIGDS